MHRLSRILGSLILVLLGLVFLTCIASADDLQTRRWAAAIVEPRRAREASLICDRILARQNRYQSVQRATWVPWHVIAGLHNMEASGSFNCHLHEGSPLTARTRYVPKGRPLAGKPPFTWEESAVDALLYDRMDCVDWQHIGTSQWHRLPAASPGDAHALPLGWNQH
jgi:lysozyme family protein